MNHEERLELSKLNEWKLLGGWGKEHPDEYTGKQRFPERSHNVLLKNKPKLDAVLSKSPYDFNIFFLRRGRKEKRKWHILSSGDEGFLDGRSALAFMREENVDVDALRWRKSINFIFLGTGIDSNNLPPTPWIVLHWMAHALTAGADGTSHDKNEYTDAMSTLGMWKEVGALIEDAYVTDVDNIKNWGFMEREAYNVVLDLDDMGADFQPHPRTSAFLLNDFFPAVFTFRSARDKKMVTIEEGVQDLFTQFIWNGRKGIEVKSPSKIFMYEDEFLVKKSGADGVFRNFKKKMDGIFKRIMDNAVGKWYYT